MSLFKTMMERLLNEPSLFDDSEGGVAFYRDVERPCWHKRKRIKRDRRKGLVHPKTHVVSEPMIRVALIDNREVGPGESMQVQWDADGIVKL